MVGLGWGLKGAASGLIFFFDFCQEEVDVRLEEMEGRDLL
jgi:hypothetical protein